MELSKRIHFGLLVISLLSLINSISGCLNNGDQKDTATEMNVYAVYLLIDQNWTSYNLSQGDLNRFELSDVPLWTTNDIIYYNWTDHSFELIQEARDRIPDNVGVFGIPFVVTVNGTRIFLGSFYVSFSSYLPDLPVITVRSFSQSEEEYIFVIRGRMDHELVNSTIIYDALLEAGKLIK